MKKKYSRPRLSGAFGSFSPALGLAGVSAGSSIIGGAFENVPGGAGNAMLTVGSETGKYVAPVAAMGFMNYSLGQMGKFGKLNRKSRKRR